MKITILRLFATAILMLLAIPAYAVSVVQVWDCELKEDKTFQDIEAVSKAWLKAARGMKGGEEMDVYLNYPVAADDDVEGIEFVLVVPSFAAWGVFEDGYYNSPADEADKAFGDVASCSVSSLWGSVKVE